MGFNSAFKGLNITFLRLFIVTVERVTRQTTYFLPVVPRDPQNVC